MTKIDMLQEPFDSANRFWRYRRCNAVAALPLNLAPGIAATPFAHPYRLRLHTDQGVLRAAGLAGRPARSG